MNSAAAPFNFKLLTPYKTFLKTETDLAGRLPQIVTPFQ